jgi:hypothetical protein
MMLAPIAGTAWRWVSAEERETRDGDAAFPRWFSNSALALDSSPASKPRDGGRCERKRPPKGPLPVRAATM